MSLDVSTIFLAAIFAFSSVFLLVPSKRLEGLVKAFPRSKKTAALLAGAATVWFVIILSQLGEADFGDYKLIFILVFGGAGILSFFYLDDFLSVRGLCVLLLLLCREFIDSAFMQEPESRLVLVSLSYITVVAAMYFGTLPYRMRDLINWLFEKPMRARIFGLGFALCAAALITALCMY